MCLGRRFISAAALVHRQRETPIPAARHCGREPPPESGPARMTTVIKEKIVGAEVVKPAPAILAYDRPAKLSGTTYKIQPPTLEAALYITINDIELPPGQRGPLEG